MPSPTALLLLLAAVAAGHPVVGVLTVVAFGLGMALALTTVGALAVFGGERLARADVRHPRWSRIVAGAPWVAGAGVVGAGCVLVVRGAIALSG